MLGLLEVSFLSEPLGCIFLLACLSSSSPYQDGTYFTVGNFGTEIELQVQTNLAYGAEAGFQHADLYMARTYPSFQNSAAVRRTTLVATSSC